MASPRPVSSVNSASASTPTAVKSANPAPAPSAAPATSAPAPNPTQVQPAAAPPIQHTSVTQTAKSTPSGTTSPSNNQSSPQDTTRSNSSTATTPQSLAPSDNDTSPGLPSASSTPSASHSAPIAGAIFAVLGVIIALAVSFWLVRRRREKFRRLLKEPPRMPPPNFNKLEGEKIIERPSIETTLAADLARLRNLDPSGPLACHNYDREFPHKESLDYARKPVSPGTFKIARKPSLRVRDSVADLSPTASSHMDVADLTQSAPAYDAKEYIGDFPSKEARISCSPPSLSPRRNHDFY